MTHKVEFVEEQDERAKLSGIENIYPETPPVLHERSVRNEARKERRERKREREEEGKRENIGVVLIATVIII